MAKYMVLYNSPAKAKEVMAATTPDQMKASMDEWIEWRDKASKSVKVDFGLPLQAMCRITADEVGDSDSKASGYALLEGDKEIILALIKTHPHLKHPNTSIDLLVLLPLPGISE